MIKSSGSMEHIGDLNNFHTKNHLQLITLADLTPSSLFQFRISNALRFRTQATNESQMMERVSVFVLGALAKLLTERWISSSFSI